MCWACSQSYKRALAKTKQQDPARHSSVFKKETRHKSEEERRQEKERKREKYMNSKMPKRPDVTKLDALGGHGGGAGGHNESRSASHAHHSSASSYPPPPKVSAANRLIGEVVQSWRRPLLGPSPG